MVKKVEISMQTTLLKHAATPCDLARKSPGESCWCLLRKILLFVKPIKATRINNYGWNDMIQKIQSISEVCPNVADLPFVVLFLCCGR